MRSLFLFLLLAVSVCGTTQSDLGVKSYSTSMRKPNMVTFGVSLNAIDNTSLTSKNGFFNMGSNWNIFPFFNTASVDVNFANVFSYGGMLTYSRLYDSVLQQDENISESSGYFAFDTNTKWYFYSSGRYGVYSFAGPSLIVADKTLIGMNFGFGGEMWITPKFGLRLQTMGKYHQRSPLLGFTHAQHSIGGLFHF
jgi:hypothetical protein